MIALNTITDRFTIDATPGEEYHVEVDPGEYLVVEAGSLVGTPAARFTHPNVAARVNRVYEFKHYHGNGGKSWTSKAGVSFYLVIPRSCVFLLPEKGYSYIPAMINGVKVRFNVSGGTVNGWTDWLHTHTQISVNHCLRDLKKLAEVAVRGTDLEPIGFKAKDEEEVNREMVSWARLGAKQELKVVVGAQVMLGDGRTPEGPFTITSIRPLRGRTSDGYSYRLPRRHLSPVPAASA
jgi:hypothetical protein